MCNSVLAQGHPMCLRVRVQLNAVLLSASETRHECFLNHKQCSLSAELVPEPGAEVPYLEGLPQGSRTCLFSFLPLVLGLVLSPDKLCSWINILIKDPLGLETDTRVCEFSC